MSLSLMNRINRNNKTSKGDGKSAMAAFFTRNF